MLARESWVEKNYPSNLVPNENVSNYQNCILTSIKDSDLNLKGCMSFEDARNNDSARVSPSERRLPSDTNSNASRRGHIAGELHHNSVPILPSLPYSASTDPSFLRILLSDSESERQNLPRLIPHHIDIRPSALRRLHQPRRGFPLPPSRP